MTHINIRVSACTKGPLDHYHWLLSIIGYTLHNEMNKHLMPIKCRSLLVEIIYYPVRLTGCNILVLLLRIVNL